MNKFKTVLCLFLVVVLILTGLGFVWWSHPPDALAASATGGRVILGLTTLGCLVGLWRLLTPESNSQAGS